MTDDVSNDKSRLISLRQASEMYGYDPNFLNELARKGRLNAQKLGGVWLTTPKDIEDYIRSRKETGRYRKDIEIDI